MWLWPVCQVWVSDFVAAGSSWSARSENVPALPTQPWVDVTVRCSVTLVFIMAVGAGAHPSASCSIFCKNCKKTGGKPKWHQHGSIKRHLLLLASKSCLLITSHLVLCWRLHLWSGIPGILNPAAFLSNLFNLTLAHFLGAWCRKWTSNHVVIDAKHHCVCCLSLITLILVWCTWESCEWGGLYC